MNPAKHSIQRHQLLDWICDAPHNTQVTVQKQQISNNTQYEKWGKILNDHNYKEQVKTVDTAQISYATHNQTR